MPPSIHNHIYVIVVYSLDDKGEAVEMHNHGWFKEQADAEQYMELAGQPVPDSPNGSYYEDPFEERWSYVLIEKVTEGPLCSTEVVANYKAEWYEDPDYEYDPSVTEYINQMRRRKFRVVKMDEPAFDASGLFGFSGI